MKKILIMIIFSLSFVVVNAKTCSEKNYADYVNLVSNITYDTNYSKSNDKFTIIFYNILDKMYIEYNGKKYNEIVDNSVTISNINSGNVVNADIYVGSNCDKIKTITINLPYYNVFYNDKLCNNYKNILLVCSSQFTSFKVTRSFLEQTIENYENDFGQETIKKEVVKDKTIIEKTISFFSEWGIRIGLGLFSIIGSIMFFSDKYRKVKYGI